MKEQARFEGLFGGGRALRVVIRSAGIWSRAGLAALSEIETAARDTPGVARTAGIWSRYRWLLLDWPPEDPAAFRDEVLADPLSRSAGWLGSDPDAVTVLATLAPGTGPKVATALERRLAAVAPPDWRIELAGLPVIERAMDRSLRRLALLQLPLLLVLGMLLLWLGFRSAAATVTPLVFVAVVMTTVLGAMGLLGVSFNLVSSILAPLLFVISLATAVHLLAGYRHELEAGREPAAAVRATYRRKGVAVVWTSLTTGVAFASFVVSPVPPVRSLGLWLAAGIGWMLVAAFGLYPALLIRLGGGRTEAPRAAGLDRRLGARSVRLAPWTAARRAPILLGFSLLSLAAVAGAARLHVDSSLLAYFRTGHPARRPIERLQERGLAAAAAEIVIELAPEDAEEGFRDPARLARLAELSARLRELPEALGAVGAGDLYRAALGDVVVEGEPGPNARWMVLGLLQGDPFASALLDDMVTSDGGAARVTLGLPLLGPDRLQPTLAAARSLAARAFPGARLSVAGELPLLLASQRELLDTLVFSLALTGLCVTAILALLAGGVAAAAIALAPNLWAVLVVFGAMGWAGVPLESSSVMVAAIALGLAVDDTIHTLVELRAEGGRSALAATLARVTPAHVLTSAVLTAGFAVCALSDFLPLAWFGSLAAVGVVAALAGDLLLLPALLARRG